MLLFSKVISQLLLPPGGLILLAAFGLVFWQKFWGRACIAIALLLFWALSTEPVRDILTSPLEMQYQTFDATTYKMQTNQATAMVLLGGGVQERSREYSGKDMLSRFSMMRTIYAAYLAKSTGLDIYATGGTPLTQTAEAEGDIMKRTLVEFGINKDKIHAESKANTTWENAVFTKNILASQGINSIILVTSAWHMPRAVACFEAQGLNVTPAPTDYFTQQENYDMRSFVPRWNVFSDSGNALHEYLGLVWYWLKY